MMMHLRLLIAAARVVAVLVAVGLFVKVGPILASHVPGHGTPAHQVRTHA
jgi:hypothetical protein